MQPMRFATRRLIERFIRLSYWRIFESVPVEAALV